MSRRASTGSAAGKKVDSSRRIVAAAEVFGQGRSKEQMEQEGLALAEETGLDVFWRPKQDVQTLSNISMRGPKGDAVLGFRRETEYCARIGPSAMCFCGFSFQQHAPAARLADADGFGWKRSLHRPAQKVGGVNDWSFADGEEPVDNQMPCSRFRFFPCTAAERSALDMQQVYRQNRVAAAGEGTENPDADEDRRATGVKAGVCINCGLSPTVHDPDTLRCPNLSGSVFQLQQPRGRGAGSGRFYESAWECVVCNRRWEDHETVVQLRAELDPFMLRGPRGERVVPLGQILDENSYGLLGNYRDSDHYSEGRNLRDRIARENDAFREQLRMPVRAKCMVDSTGLRGMKVEREYEVPHFSGGNDVPTLIDTSGAFRGRGSMMEAKANNDEDQADFVGQRADGSWSHIR